MAIKSGVFSANTGDPGWTLDQGSGLRTFDKNIDFPGSFPVTPSVVVSLNHIDAYKDWNLRIRVHVVAVNTTSFTVRFETWADTQIFGAGCSYIVYVN